MYGMKCMPYFASKGLILDSEAFRAPLWYKTIGEVIGGA